MKKIFTLLLMLSSIAAFSQSLVISQVYGGGGNGGSVYKNDFVELFNPTSAAINVNDWSIQYNSATSTTTTWQKTKLPNVNILPGQYYLVQMAVGAGGTTNLPTPDFIGAIPMSGSNGKLVLVSDTNAIAIACPSANVIDKVGYGTATCFEGAATAPTFGSNTNAIFRAGNGCTDTNDNAADFTAGVAAPRNSTSPLNPCGAVVPALVATSATLANFGSVLIGANSAAASFSLSGSNLAGAPANITITAPSSDFQVSLDNSSWTASSQVLFTTSTLAATTVYVRFTPQSGGALTGNITISGGGTTTATNVSVSGTGLTALLPTLSATALSSFGTICLNATAVPNSFSVNGANLTAADITVGPLAGYNFSTTSTGSYTASVTLVQAGGTYSQEIFVNFTPVVAQSYSGNIPVSGGGAAAAINVSASGAGFNAPPSATTGVATGITSFAASLPASITADGCTAVTAYGIEFSTVNGFVTGTVVPATNLAAGAFSSPAVGLLPSTTYYYKAYATNGGGKAYGFQSSFTTLPCAPPTVTTGNETALTISSVTLAGSITDQGCTAVTAAGIEYSGIRAFPNGFVKKFVAAGNAGASFTIGLTGLVPGSKYYYRSYATNQGGTSRSDVDSFTTQSIKRGLIVYSNPVKRGMLMYFSLDNLPKGYYGVKIISAAGQLIAQKDLSTQVGFINSNLFMPATLEAGLYILRISNNNGFTTQKTILVVE